MEKNPKGIPSKMQNKAGNRNMVEDSRLVAEALEQKLKEIGTGEKGTNQRHKVRTTKNRLLPSSVMFQHN